MTPQMERHTSRIELALGAVSLFFFLVGVKRSYRTEDGGVILRDQKMPFAHAGEGNSPQGISQSG